MIYLQLFIEFFKTGLFSFGGGYATIPFLYHISEQFHWYTYDDLKHMIAVASVTPGPIGINVATYAGVKTAGILGGVAATIPEMLPSLCFVLIVAKLLKNYSDNFYVKAVIETLKPISCALLVSVALNLLIPEIRDIKAMILLTAFLLLSWKSKKDPIFYIFLSAIIGIIIAL